MSATVEAPVELRCSMCRETFTMSARRARDHRGEAPVCWSCQHPPREPTEAERAALRKWWTDRYSREELLELGRLLWGND